MIKLFSTLFFSLFFTMIFSQDLIPVRGENEKFGYKNSNGKLIIDYKYTNASDFSEGVAAVRFEGKSGFIDRNEKTVLPFIYEDVESFKEGLAAVKMDKKWGFINKSGKLMIPCIYERVNNFREGLAAVAPVWKEGFGYINQQGEMVIPVQYKYPSNFDGGVALVSNGKESFHIDKSGKNIDKIDSAETKTIAQNNSNSVQNTTNQYFKNIQEEEIPNEKIDTYQLSKDYQNAIANKNTPIEERRKIARKLKIFLKNDSDEKIIQYTYIGDLLKDSDDPKDVYEAVKAYDYFLRNTKHYGYNFPNDYPDVESTLSFLLISKYYYLQKIGELPEDSRFSLNQAVYWFNGSVNNNNATYDYEKDKLKSFATTISSLQKFKMQNNNPQAQAETMAVINKYSGIFLAKLGDVIKYADKKQAKKWYNDALALGNTNAKQNLANIDKPRPKTLQDYGYGSPDAVEQRLEKPVAKDYTAENKEYNDWWEKTYGKGGTQNSKPMPNNNPTQASMKTAKDSEEERHRKAMEQITRETEKQSKDLNKSR